MAKILVADDEVDLETLIKQNFRRQIREHKYEFVFALNGEEALQLVTLHPDIDIVLSDINMPVMDGLTLLSQTAGSKSAGANRDGISLWGYGKHSHGHEPRRL